MNMTGEQTMKPVAMKLDMSGAGVGGRMKVIVVKGMAYLSTPDVPAGKYVKVNPADTSDPMAAGLNDAIKQLDPSKTFEAFDIGLSKVEFVRTETVQGRKLDRYAATLDLVAVAKAKGEKVPAKGGRRSLVYTIWMGSTDHLMYQIYFELQEGAKMTMTFSDWNKPLSIKAPPASAIVRR
jgi:hypothetical protein